MKTSPTDERATSLGPVATPLLAVRDLVVRFSTADGVLTAVDGLSFEVPAAGAVALVGESGCGKSVTAQAILRLLPEPPAHIARGRVELEGRNLLELPAKELRRVRGARISMVFQDPVSALHPLYTVGSQLCEAMRIHQRLSRARARDRAVELLGRVGLPEPALRFGCYPHELSGGMCQRVMIAIALACDPAVLIADEPTTALDMVAARGIVRLLAEIRKERELALLIISHDMGIVGQLADRVVVLYAGQAVEMGHADDVLRDPRHPYTTALLRAIPPRRSHQRRRRPSNARLPAIPGALPDPFNLPHGCRFAERCAYAVSACRERMPELEAFSGRSGEPMAVRCSRLDGRGRLPAVSSRALLIAEHEAP